MAEPAPPPGRLDIPVSTVSWGLVVVALSVLTVMARIEPKIADGTPRLGSAAWWARLLVAV